MSYIKKSLSADESIIELFKLHWMVWIFPTILVLFGLLLVAGSSDVPGQENPTHIVGYIVLAIAAYKILGIKTQERGVTSKRVVRKDGIIARKTEEVRLTKIETVEVKQGILERLLGSGSVVLTGTGSSDLILNGIENPMKVKRSIDSLLD
jgi:uncharacterized membrane protein YdbT with pleckstrin-like domain